LQLAHKNHVHGPRFQDDNRPDEEETQDHVKRATETGSDLRTVLGGEIWAGNAYSHS
jgi:hypothetical protein